jgi:predicted glycosyltransferase involved in capsule biosynthesis
MPANTIIIPFRRTASIPLCLTSLEVCGDIDQHNIILAQHGGMVHEFDRDDLPLRYWYVHDQDAFHYSKLVNGAVKRANSEWVTILQADVLVPFDFITQIENAQGEPANRLCYFPIRYLDSAATQGVESHFNSFYEQVVPFKAHWRRGTETHGRCLIGTVCFTVRTSSYLELGGLDERFHERGLATIDFGRRWFNAFGPPVCIDCHVFHRWARTGDCEEYPPLEISERSLLVEKERQGFPPPEITKQWGVFQQSAN